MIAHVCPGCSATSSLDESMAGKASVCPFCRHESTVPHAETLPPSHRPAHPHAETLPPVHRPTEDHAETMLPVSRPAAPDARAPVGYVIERELGRGGMGVVYLARSLALDRLCALKVILSGAHSGEDEVERFHTEAKAIARLQHPGIVQVFESGEHDGRPFMALEYCAGGSLDERLRKNPLPPREAAALIQHLAEAMQAAHEADIVHRDLKPGNVLLSNPPAHAGGSPALVPKVTDFGLAKRLDERGQTQTGDVMGTPSYMPPEQARGDRDVGPAADVYALGAILYHCLASRPPFRAATAAETLVQVLNDEPVPLRRLAPHAPADLENICARCLQKDPRRRYASAQELADDLGRYLAGEPVRARPVGPAERASKWVRRNKAIASLAAAVLLALVAGVTVSSLFALQASGEAKKASDRADAEAVAKRTAQDEKKRADAEAKAAGEASDEAKKQTGIATDALAKAEANLEQAELVAYASQLTQARYEVMAGNLGVARKILQTCRWDLRGVEHRCLWDLANARQTLKATSKEVHCVAVSPDGTRIAAGTNKGADVWDAETGRRLATLPDHGGPVKSVAFSPDGKRLVTASPEHKDFGRNSYPHVKVCDADTGHERLALWWKTGAIVSAAFAPDGRHVVLGFVAGDVSILDVETKKVVRHAPFTPKNTRVAVRSDGRYVATADGHRWDLATDQAIRFNRVAERASSWEVAFSPDGSRLAFAVASTTKPAGKPIGKGVSKAELVVLDAIGGAQTLSVEVGSISALAFDADGRRIATGGTDRLVKVWDAEKGELLFSTEAHDESVTGVAFGRDDRLVTCGSDGLVRVWDLPREDDYTFRFGRRQQVSTPRLGQSLSLGCFVTPSPDGRWLAGVPRGEATLFDARTGKATPLEGGKLVRAELTLFHFSADGRRVACGDGDAVAVWDVPSGKLIARMRGHAAPVALVQPGDGDLVVSRDFAGTVKSWDVGSGKELASFSAADKGVTFSPGGDYCAARKYGERLELWDVRRAESRVLAEKGTGSPTFSVDGKRIACANEDGVTVWDTRDGKVVSSFPEKDRGFAPKLVFAPDGKTMILVSGGLARGSHTMRVVDVEKGAELFRIGGAGSPVFTPDGKRIATLADGVVTFWDARSGRELLVARAGAGGIGSLMKVGSVLWAEDSSRAFATGLDLTRTEMYLWRFRRRCDEGETGATASTSGPLALLGWDRGRPALFDRRTMRPSVVLEGQKGRVPAFASSHDGTRVATGDGDENVARMFDARTGKQLRTFVGHSRTVQSLAFSPDDTRLATAGRDETVKVWDVATGEVLHSLAGHGTDSNHVWWSPARDRLLTCHRKFKLWDAGTGELLHTLDGVLPFSASSPAFSPDGRRLAAVCPKEVKVWDTVSGELLFSASHPRGNHRIAFGPAGDRLFVWGNYSRDDALAWTVPDGKPIDPGGVRDLSPRRIRDRDYNKADRLSLVLPEGSDPPENAWPFSTGGRDAKEQADQRRRYHADFAAKAERSDDPFVAAYHLERLLALSPLDATLHVRLAHAHAALDGGRDKAALHLTQALLLNPRVSLWPDDPDAGRRGSVAAGQKDWPLAVRNFRLAVRQKGTGEGHWSSLLAAGLAGGDEQAARETAAEVLADGKHAVALRFWLAAVPLDRADAERLLKAMANKRDAAGLHFQGAALYRAGRYDEAWRLLTASVEVQGNGGFADTWIFLALTQQKRGKRDEAARQLARYANWHAAKKPEDWQYEAGYRALLDEGRREVGVRE